MAIQRKAATDWISEWFTEGEMFEILVILTKILRRLNPDKLDRTLKKLA